MKNQKFFSVSEMRLMLLSIALLFPVLFFSCSSAKDNFVDKPFGNNIDLVLKSTYEYKDVELLYVDQDTLYAVYEEARILPVSLKDISKITVNGYSDRSWIAAVVGFQVVPAILIGVASSSEGSAKGWAIGGLMLLPAALEFSMFESSTPKEPLFQGQIENYVQGLKKYSRYPIDLTRDQINSMEKFYGLLGGVKNK